MRLRFARAVREAFPGLAAQLLTLENLRVATKDPKLEKRKMESVRRLRASLLLETLKDEPRLRAYRDFFWRIGVDPTKIRPASEALLRRVLHGREMPRINTLVDTYNLASMETRVALAAFDLATLEGDLRMRFAQKGEHFRGIGMGEPMRLQGKEIVVDDDHGPIAIYPYRDAHHTRIIVDTRGAVIMVCGVPGLEEGALQEAADRVSGLVARFCGGPPPQG